MALEVCQVVAEKVAEAFELGDARVLAAKFEGLLAGAVVDELELGVVPEDLLSMHGTWFACERVCVWGGASNKQCQAGSENR